MGERKYGENVTVHEYNGAHTGKKRTATLWLDGRLEYIEPIEYPPTKPRLWAYVDYEVTANEAEGYDAKIYVTDVATGEVVVKKALIYQLSRRQTAEAHAEAEALKLAKEAGFEEIRERGAFL